MSTNLLNFVSSCLINVQFCLLPGVCVLCRHNTGLHKDLCKPCLATLKRLKDPCLACGIALPEDTHSQGLCGKCLLGKTHIERSVMAFSWQAPASSLISRFKYQRQLQYGRVLSDLLAEHLHTRYVSQALPELLIPIPLHWRKLSARGFNQALLIAKQLSSRFDIPVDTSILKRIRHTPGQQGLSARQRKENLKSAFAIEQSALAKLGKVKSIAIVDDVVTTMTTANSAASLLSKHLPGKPKLHLWALARA